MCNVSFALILRPQNIHSTIKPKGKPTPLKSMLQIALEINDKELLEKLFLHGADSSLVFFLLLANSSE